MLIISGKAESPFYLESCSMVVVSYFTKVVLIMDVRFALSQRLADLKLLLIFKNNVYRKWKKMSISRYYLCFGG